MDGGKMKLFIAAKEALVSRILGMELCDFGDKTGVIQQLSSLVTFNHRSLIATMPNHILERVDILPKSSRHFHQPFHCI